MNYIFFLISCFRWKVIIIHHHQSTYLFIYNNQKIYIQQQINSSKDRQFSSYLVSQSTNQPDNMKRSKSKKPQPKYQIQEYSKQQDDSNSNSSYEKPMISSAKIDHHLSKKTNFRQQHQQHNYHKSDHQKKVNHSRPNCINEQKQQQQYGNNILHVDNLGGVRSRNDSSKDKKLVISSENENSNSSSIELNENTQVEYYNLQFSDEEEEQVERFDSSDQNGDASPGKEFTHAEFMHMIQTHNHNKIKNKNVNAFKQAHKANRAKKANLPLNNYSDNNISQHDCSAAQYSQHCYHLQPHNKVHHPNQPQPRPQPQNGLTPSTKDQTFFNNNPKLYQPQHHLSRFSNKAQNSNYQQIINIENNNNDPQKDSYQKRQSYNLHNLHTNPQLISNQYTKTNNILPQHNNDPLNDGFYYQHVDRVKQFDLLDSFQNLNNNSSNNKFKSTNNNDVVVVKNPHIIIQQQQKQQQQQHLINKLSTSSTKQRTKFFTQQVLYKNQQKQQKQKQLQEIDSDFTLITLPQIDEQNDSHHCCIVGSVNSSVVDQVTGTKKENYLISQQRRQRKKLDKKYYSSSSTQHYGQKYTKQYQQQQQLKTGWRYQQAKLKFIDNFMPDSMKIGNNPYNMLKYINHKNQIVGKAISSMIIA